MSFFDGIDLPGRFESQNANNSTSNQPPAIKTLQLNARNIDLFNQKGSHADSKGILVQASLRQLALNLIGDQSETTIPTPSPNLPDVLKRKYKRLASTVELIDSDNQIYYVIVTSIQRINDTYFIQADWQSTVWVHGSDSERGSNPPIKVIIEHNSQTNKTWLRRA